MTSKKIVLMSSALLLSLLGIAAWSYAGCGACGACPAAAPAQTASAAPVTVTKPFHVLDVTGPAKGQELCYICRYGGRPSLVVFTRTLEGAFPDVVKAIDKTVAEHKEQRLAAFVVLLADNTEANRAKLAKLAHDHGLSVPLTIAAEGPEGPKAYNLGDNRFETLVLVTHRNQVQQAITLGSKCATCTKTRTGKIAEINAAAQTLLKNI